MDFIRKLPIPMDVKAEYPLKPEWEAVRDQKIEELTREVREHNNFARRMPVVEEQIKVANHRIHDLEGFHRHE